jgi:hypothetical protein
MTTDAARDERRGDGIGGEELGLRPLELEVAHDPTIRLLHMQCKNIVAYVTSGRPRDAASFRT